MKPDFPTADPWRRFLVAACLGISAVALSGCISTAAGAGAGVVAYARGELEADVDGDYDKVVDASRGALVDLGFARASENKDDLRAVLITRAPTDKKVELIVSNTGKKLTNIKIRVGVFGDEQVSRRILDKVKARL